MATTTDKLPRHKVRHVTFKSPLPRIIVAGVSTQVLAASVESMTPSEVFGGGGAYALDMQCVAFIVFRDGKETPIKMRSVLTVAENHVASMIAVEVQ
jgi:hypothetical protein